ncbi:thioredoxin-dependent thiol peroxidase [Clostridium sediminicola]|uniref:thioredoxin-dependent thiol peroxidase n=1 Tax=Clostridium sediminicola TaxID=3114879 RepID=UPI0031F212DD
MNNENIIELSIGMKAPDFTISGSDNQNHTLSHYRGKNVILYFYPRDNTPGCTKEAESFRDHHRCLTKLNTIVLGISSDALKSHNKFIEKLKLPFILLSDEDEKVCKLYDVLKEKKLYGKISIGIERSTFIIDEEGIIRKIYRKVRVKEHVANIITFLDKNK